MCPEKVLEFDEQSPLSIWEKQKLNMMKNEARQDKKLSGKQVTPTSFQNVTDEAALSALCNKKKKMSKQKCAAFHA